MNDLVRFSCHPVAPNSRTHIYVLHECWHSLVVRFQDATVSHSHATSCYSLGFKLEKSNTIHKIRNFWVGRLSDCLGWVMNPNLLSDLHTWQMVWDNDEEKWVQNIPTRWAIPLISQKLPAVAKATCLVWQIKPTSFFANERLTRRFKPYKNKLESNLG